MLKTFNFPTCYDELALNPAHLKGMEFAVIRRWVERRIGEIMNEEEPDEILINFVMTSLEDARDQIADATKPFNARKI